MPEKFFDSLSAIVLIMVFFVCSVTYNIGYFGTLGDSIYYFFHMPASLSDIIKTGSGMILPLIFILIIFKPILINPPFNGTFPGAAILLTIAVLVLISNFLYFVVFSNSQNKTLSLISEVAFYLFALVCFIALVYYFLNGTQSTYYLLIVFCLSLVAISFLIGVVGAKISVNSSYTDQKSQILLTNDKVINANVLRSFDKGIFVIIDKTANVNFVPWSEVKVVKFAR